jgi:thioredoxin 1
MAKLFNFNWAKPNQRTRIFAMSLLKHTTDASFDDDVINAALPVLVDFWAEWCGPCKKIAPVLEELAADYEGRLTIVKVNVDEHAGSPAKFGIRGIPTLLLFKKGTVIATKVGAASKSQLAAFIDNSL